MVDGEYNIIRQNSQKYNFVTPGKDRVELDFRLLRSKILDALKPLTEELSRVKGICFSVLCPGLVPMDREGEPLHNAIIHLDRRSVKQARAALSLIGEKKFLSVAGNLPFPGGISLTSMLWLKQNMPQIYKETYMLGHTNTFLAKMFTGRFGIDPSNASFTGLYDTVHYSGWSQDIIKALDLDDNKLPPVYYSDQVIGKTTRHISKLTGIPAGVPVTHRCCRHRLCCTGC
ncbi:MAG: FGGY family carbohydrate kinase [Actinomycetota bacterium]|nr:FGGY family carbohydrate kinase [Actinomycetota bacterium]